MLSGLQMQFPLSTVTVSTLGENLLRSGDDDAWCKLVVDPALESPITSVENCLILPGPGRLTGPCIY